MRLVIEISDDLIALHKAAFFCDAGSPPDSNLNPEEEATYTELEWFREVMKQDFLGHIRRGHKKLAEESTEDIDENIISVT